MKILILSANTFMSPDPVYPLGAAYIATACKEAGHEVQTFDSNFREEVYPQLIRELESFDPEVIGISLRNIDDTTFPNTTSFIPYYRELTRTCRDNSDAKIVLGGSAYSLFPKELYEILQPDFGIVGEGEQTFLNLLDALGSGKKVSEKIIYSRKIETDNKQFRLNPDRTLFDFKKYYDQGGMLNIQTKRGCAFNCSYCTYPYLEGFKLRLKDPMAIVDELERMVQDLNIKSFFFVDSVFNFPEEHAMEICREIIRRGLRLRWSAYIRPTFKDPEMLSVMKEAGCKSIELGTDSMDPEILKSMNKNLNLDEIFEFCEKAYDLNIDYAHSLIFGAPGENLDTVKNTVKNVNATNPTAVLGFLGIRVFPNTLLADHCIKTGYYKEDQINLDPVFFISEDRFQEIYDYLQQVLKEDQRWIIPGIEEFDLGLLQEIRKRKKRGMSWELKKFVDYL